MRRGAAIAVLALAAVVAVSACRQYLPSSRYLGAPRLPKAVTTADARGKFDHPRHAKAVLETGTTCLDCHRFDVTVEADTERAERGLRRAALYPGGAACHFCHRESETRLAGAPSACTTCHENLEPLMPESHEVAWLKAHANAARGDGTQCESCHRQAFCIDCHQRRDSIQTRVHERTFRFFHSIEARANPMQCGSCHRQDFCIRCHQQGGAEGAPE